MNVIKIYVSYRDKDSPYNSESHVRTICFENENTENTVFCLKGTKAYLGMILGSNVYNLLIGKYREDCWL